MKYLILILALCSACFAAIGTPTCQGGSNTATTTVTTASLSVTLGDFVWFTSGQQSDSTSTYSVGDSGGNSWTDGVYSPSDANGETQKLSWMTAKATASITVTATWNNSVTSSTALACNASGIYYTNPLDPGTNVVNPGSGFILTINTAPYTTATANDLLVNCVRMSGGVTTPVADVNYTIPTNGTAGGRHTCEYRIVSATQSAQTASLTWTSTAHASSVFGAFRMAPTTRCVTCDMSGEVFGQDPTKFLVAGL